MSRYTKFAPVAALAALAATATPALAAPSGHRDGPDRIGYHSADYGKHYVGFGQAAQIKRDIARLNYRINSALARHHISRREAMGLRQDVRELTRMYNRFSTGGLTRWEARTLEAKLARANRSFRMERRDRDRRIG